MFETEEQLSAFRYGVRMGTFEERERIIQLLHSIVPGSEVMGDDIELAITLIKGENE